MSFWDVLSGNQSLGCWLTGRESEKDADLHIENTNQAKQVIQELQNMTRSSGCVTTLGVNMVAAVAKLNSTPGIDYLGGIGYSESAFDEVGMLATQLASELQQKLDDAEYYAAPLGTKILSTAAMVGAKIGEGFLSAFEDIGDGVVSVVGWIAPKDSAVEKWCENFVEKDWSHDAFNFYYNSDLAKKSAITQNSAIAGACEIGGKAAGYLYAGGMINGLTGLSKVGKAGEAAKGIFKIASGSTWSATIAAGVGGFGAGTETGLYNGLSFDEAAASYGVKQGLTNAAVAFIGGKIGERGARMTAAKTNAGPGASRAAIRTEFKGLSGNVYEGYTDVFSNAGREFGETIRSAPLKGIITANPVAQIARGTVQPLTYNPATGAVERVAVSAGRGAVKLITSPLRATGDVVKTTFTGGGAAAVVNAARDQVGQHGQAEEQFRQNGIVGKNPPVSQEPPVVTFEPAQESSTTTPEPVAPVETVPTESAPVGGTPTESTPVGGTPGGGTSTGTIPGGSETFTGTQPEATTAIEPTQATPIETEVAPVETVPTVETGGPVTVTTLAHSGGEYSEETGFTGEELDDLDDLVDDTELTTSIDDIIKGNKYSKIPTSSSPINRNDKTSTGSSFIPISAGLSAAAAVGLGAKAYLNKKEKEEEEEEDIGESWTDDNFEIAEEVPEEESLEEEDSTLQSRIIESITGEEYAG